MTSNVTRKNKNSPKRIVRQNGKRNLCKNTNACVNSTSKNSKNNIPNYNTLLKRYKELPQDSKIELLYPHHKSNNSYVELTDLQARFNRLSKSKGT